MYSGDMISRMNTDATDFVNLIYWSGFWGYSNLLHIVFSVGFMFYYNVFLGIATLILVPVVYVTSKYFENKSQMINKEISKEQGKLSSYLFEIVKSLEEIRILNVCNTVRKRYIEKTAAINKLKVESGRMDILAERTNALISLIAQLLIFIICAYFIVKKEMKLGAFVSAISYFNMATYYFSVINGRIVDVGKQKVSIQRVVDILNEEEEDYKENASKCNISEGVIDFRNVSFSYNNEKKILNGLNIHIDSNSIVGIVGKSGAGKTTIANLLYDLYRVDKGEILIDGYNVNDFNLHYLRSQVGVVHQETIVYENTLRYNLSFCDGKVDDDTLINAIKKVALYDVYISLKDGLNTILGSSGHQLSSGQKQRLAIARIIIKNPKILVFDESTAFLDSQNEDIIRDMMFDLAKDRTLIIISHRLSTIKNCDKIVVLKNGVADGFDTHNNLIKNNRTYIDLFSEQCIAGGEVS